jgi:hypothetical protein
MKYNVFGMQVLICWQVAQGMSHISAFIIIMLSIQAVATTPSASRPTGPCKCLTTMCCCHQVVSQCDSPSATIAGWSCMGKIKAGSVLG